MRGKYCMYSKRADKTCPAKGCGVLACAKCDCPHDEGLDDED